MRTCCLAYMIDVEFDFYMDLQGRAKVIHMCFLVADMNYSFQEGKTA